MIAVITIYSVWIILCLVGTYRPWIAITGFYGCVLLEPDWNWRWSIPHDIEFQQWLAISACAGFVLTGLRMHNVKRAQIVAIACFLTFLSLGFISARLSLRPTLSSYWMDQMWKITLTAILAILLIDKPKRAWIFLMTLSLSQGYSAFRITESYLDTGINMYAYRPWGYKGDNNLYSNLTVPLIAVSASLACYSKKTWQNVLFGLVMMLQIHQLMLMDSRGAMLAAACMLALFLWWMPKTKQTIRIIIASTVIGAALAGPPVVQQFKSIFYNEEERDGSASSRFALWEAGWEITKDYPLIGVGPYAAQYLMPRYYRGPGETVTRRKGLHNLFFQITTNFGIPAAIFYFSFLLIPWWLCCKVARRLRKQNHYPPWYSATCLAVATGVPGYLIASMFSSAALLESPYALASLGLAAHALYHRSEHNVPTNLPLPLQASPS